MRSVLASFPIVLVLATSACGTEPPPTICSAARYYRIDQVQLPQLSGEGARYGLDLDGDGNIDNALARLVEIARLGNADLGDLDPLATARLTSGEAIWLVGVSDCDDGSARIELRRGEDPDGDGVPSLVPGPASFASTSEIDGVTAAGGGEADVPLTVLADPLGTFTPIAWHRARLAAVRFHVDPAGGHSVDGVVAFALPMPDAAVDLVAPYAAYLTGELAAGTSPFAVTVDTNHDGVVTPAEVLADDNARIVTAPDLTIGDGHAFSGGVGIHATPTAIAP